MKLVASLISLICIAFTGLGQTVTIHGTVIDADSRRYLPGVSVFAGEAATITDSAGHFNLILQTSTLKQDSLIFTYVGYLKKKAAYTSSSAYNIELKASYSELPEVQVIGSGLSVLAKAIHRIPQNYPNAPYQSTGFMRLQYLRNNSDYFNSDAIVQIYTPSINSNKTGSVRVVQNHIDTISDRSLIFIKWIGGYLSPVHADFVKNNEPFIDLKKMKRFKYQLMGKQVYNNRTTFVINFSQKDSTAKQKATGGTLFIDSATLAFAGADISYYNLSKYGTLPQSRQQYHVRYTIIDHKWYLQESFSKGNTIYKQENPTTLVNYVTIKTDTANIKSYGYKDIIQEQDVTQLISKPGDPLQLTGIDVAFKNTERYKELIKPTDLDAIRDHHAASQRKRNNWLNYFTGNNFRYSLSFIRFPLRLNDPVHNRSYFVNYGFQIGTYFRIYKDLFFEFEGSGNTGTQKTVLSLYAFHLAYNINLNPYGRSVTISPFAGYDLLTINQKTDKRKGWADYLVYGLKGSLELSHHVFLLASVSRNDMILKGESDFLPAAFTPAIGVLIKR